VETARTNEERASRLPGLRGNTGRGPSVRKRVRTSTEGRKITVDDWGKKRRVGMAKWSGIPLRLPAGGTGVGEGRPTVKMGSAHGERRRWRRRTIIVALKNDDQTLLWDLTREGTERGGLCRRGKRGWRKSGRAGKHAPIRLYRPAMGQGLREGEKDQKRKLK